MPQMSGYDMCKILREQYPANTLPVIMVSPPLLLISCVVCAISGCHGRAVTPQVSVSVCVQLSAKNQEQDIVMGLEAGCNDYISKPYGSSELQARIGVQFKLRSLWLLELSKALSDREAILPATPKVSETDCGVCDDCTLQI